MCKNVSLELRDKRRELVKVEHTYKELRLDIGLYLGVDYYVPRVVNNRHVVLRRFVACIVLKFLQVFPADIDKRRGGRETPIVIIIFKKAPSACVLHPRASHFFGVSFKEGVS